MPRRNDKGREPVRSDVSRSRGGGGTIAGGGMTAAREARLHEIIEDLRRAD